MEILSAYSLPPGFGFHPTDVELISHYLKRKILGMQIEYEIIPEVDIYKHEPWDLPEKTHIPSRDCKWHFFTSRDRKYPNGFRSNRATEAGYWKSTGKDRNIRVKNCVIGTKKTLVFHKGRPPNGKRSDWIMHEYYLNENECEGAPGMKDIYVLCRVTKRNGLDPEDKEASAIWVEESISVPSKSSKKLEDTSASPMQKKESSSLSKNEEDLEEDLEAWLSELYDPSFCTIPTVSELTNEIKVDQSSLAPKQESVDSTFSPHAVENLQLPLQEGDDLDDILDDQFNTLEFYTDLFAEIDFKAVDTTSTHLFDAEAAMGYLSPEELSVGIYSEANSSNPVRLLDSHGNPSVVVKDEKEIKASTPNISRTQGYTDETGIQIRERRAGPSNNLTNQRIRLQVHKMESHNHGSVDQTFVFVSKDHHLNSTDEFSASSKPFRRTATSNQANIEVLGKFTTGESSSAATKSEEICISESTRKEVLSWKDESITNKPRKLSLVRRVIGGVGLFIRRCSSASLNCLFLVTCMMGTAALIAHFLLRDVRRLLNNLSALGS